MSVPSSACIMIYAQNDETTVGGVVQAALGSGVFRDVIVLSDASTDGSADAANSAGASYVRRFQWKQGRSRAFFYGVSLTDAPILFFSGADSTGFDAAHVRSVLEPVASGACSACAGIREDGSRHEVAVVRRVFDGLPDTGRDQFDIDALIQEYCRRHALNHATVRLSGVRSRHIAFFEPARIVIQRIKAAVLLRVSGWKGNDL